MALGFGQADRWVWPADLERAKYAKADKTKKIENVLGSLADGKKLIDALNPPFIPGSASAALWDKWETDAQAFISGPLTKFHGSLKILDKRIKTAKTDKEAIKESECKKALSALETACVDLMGQADPASFGKHLQAGRLEGEKFLRDNAHKLVGSTVAAWKAVTSGGHKEVQLGKKELLDASKADPAVQKEAITKAGQTLRQGARAMTQNVGNVIKFKKSGVLVPGLAETDYTAMEKMFKTLSKWANSEGDWTNGALADAAMGAKTISAQTPMFDQIGKKMG